MIFKNLFALAFGLFSFFLVSCSTVLFEIPYISLLLISPLSNSFQRIKLAFFASSC